MNIALEFGDKDFEWDVCRVKKKKVLTREHGGEEDVVGEGDKAAFSQSVKYTVLICKLLPLLGNLLLTDVRAKRLKGRRKHFYSMQR